MEPITLVGDAMRALTFKAIDLHVSYVADDITVEEIYADNSPPRVVHGKDAYRDFIDAFATLPEGLGIAGFEVAPTGPPSDVEPIWVHVILHVGDVSQGRARGMGPDFDVATRDLLVAVRDDRICTLRAFPQRPKVYRYP